METNNEEILNLLLEIIYLLTGKDYVPAGDWEASSSQPRGWSKTRGPITGCPSPIPERNNEQRILDLINRLMELLTREVPIRCQDVAVYFSMEEWEYVEGHKDLHRDAMMEDQPPLSVSGFRAAGFRNKDQNKEVMTSAPSPSCREQEYGENNGNGEGMTGELDSHSMTGADYTTRTPYPSCDRGNVTTIHNPADQTLCRANHFIEEYWSCKEGNFPSSMDQTPHNLFPLQYPVLCDGGNLTDPNISTPTSHTQYTFPPPKEEPVSSDGGTFMDIHFYTPTDYTQHLTTPLSHHENLIVLGSHSPKHHRQRHPTTHIKEEPALYQQEITDTYGGMSTDLTQHPFPCVKVELISCNGDSLTVLDIHAAEDTTQQYPSTYNGKETVSHDGENLPAPDCTELSTEEPVLDQIVESSSVGELVDKDDNKNRKKRTEQNYNDITISSKKYFCTIQQTTNSLEILYNCPECPECFTSNLDLAKHQIIHTGGMPFICSVCGRCFGRKSDLLEHQTTHEGSNEFICSHCHFSFATQSSLSIHEKTHEEKKPLPCPECGKTFPTKKRLTRHQQIHTDERPFECMECGESFKRKAHLQRHKAVHEKAKQTSTCNQCGDFFRSKVELRDHQTVHEEKKVFKPSDGRSSLTDKAEVPKQQVEHSCSKPLQRLHNAKPPFQVHHKPHTLQGPQCSMSSLQMHQKAHISGKPIVAPELTADLSKDSRSFSYQETLAEHIALASSACSNQSIDTKRKHPYKIVKLLPCPLCGKCFPNYSKLNRHYNIHPRETPPSQSLANSSNSLPP